MRIHRLILDFFFPKICPYCHRAVPTGHQKCSCDTSEFTIADKLNKKGLQPPENNLQYVFKAVAPTYYMGAAKRAVLRYKYGFLPGLGDYLADEMANCIQSHFDMDTIDFLCYVPATKRDVRQKMLHHTKWLCRQISRKLNKKMLDSLAKIYETDKQHSLDKFRRSANVLGAYEVIDTTLVAGKCALLIDDILTTGHTADECAKMLRVRGCKQVLLCTFAFASPEIKNKENINHGKQRHRN